MNEGLKERFVEELISLVGFTNKLVGHSTFVVWSDAMWESPIIDARESLLMAAIEYARNIDKVWVK